MTNEEIIQGLQFTIDMFLFDPFTGESLTEPRNDEDKITIDACREAIASLKAEPCEDAVRRETVRDMFCEIHCHNERSKCVFRNICKYMNRVSALPPVTPKLTECEDCVSREAVLDALHVEGRPTKRFDYVIDVKRDIMTLPPVTPKQKTGKWTDDKCSVCGKGIEDLISSPEWYRNKEPKFCPFCGTKMEGESE